VTHIQTRYEEGKVIVWQRLDSVMKSVGEIAGPDGRAVKREYEHHVTLYRAKVPGG
jgi:hypothetical protein